MWPFANFQRWEFVCRCSCGFDDIDLGLVTTLQRLRDEVGKPVQVNSGCRCPTHNRRVGGSPRSQHMVGRAADIRVDGMTSIQIIDVLKRLYLDHEAYVGFAYAVNGAVVHVDVRTPESQTVRRWRG